MTQNILLITKNYPPQIGGIEKYSFDLNASLINEKHNVKLITARQKNGFFLEKMSGNIFFKSCNIVFEFFRLSFFSAKCLVFGVTWCMKTLTNKNSGGIITIWSLDGSIAWIGLFVKEITQFFLWILKIFKPFQYIQIVTKVTGHGKDIAWNYYFYQKILRFSLRKTDSIIAVSHTIKDLLIGYGIEPSKITVIEHSLKSLSFIDAGIFDKENFLKSYSIPKDKILLFSIGRFVEKKGFHWFISEVLPMLDSKYHFVLAGGGPLVPVILQTIIDKKINNITLVGAVNDAKEKAKFYLSCDYFLMPNIQILGDCEGYGIVLLEAQYYKAKSIVSDIDGINTRIGEGDFVLTAQCPKEWISFLNNL